MQLHSALAQVYLFTESAPDPQKVSHYHNLWLNVIDVEQQTVCWAASPDTA